MIPEDLRYTREHEWIRVQGETAEVGITHFAQDQLGDIVYVKLPAPGTRLEAHRPFGEVESVKTISELYAPVSGEVLETNPLLDSEAEDFSPEIVNDDPYHKGWMIRMRLDRPAEVEELLDAQAYARHIEGG
jgi:glycine cleavage system H protein